MKRLRLDQDIQPLSEFRSGAASFLKQVHETKRPLLITQNGKGVAVLLDVKEYERMQERLELLDEISLAEKQLASGSGIDHDEAKSLVLKSVNK